MKLNKYSENKITKYLNKTRNKSQIVFELVLTMNEYEKNKNNNYKFDIVQVINPNTL